MQGEATGAQARAPSASPVVHANPPRSRLQRHLPWCSRGCWTRCPAQSRQREAKDSESSMAERRSERATPKGDGAGSTAGSQPDDEVSDQCGLVSESGLFASAAKQSWSVSRLWLRSCLGRHAEHRAHIAAALARRSLAASGVVGCDRAVLDCLGSLQPAERMQRELASFLADAKWSAAAAKLTRQSSGAGRTVPRR